MKGLEFYRRSLGLTGEQMGHLVNASKGQISLWEKGNRRIPKAKMFLFQEVFGEASEYFGENVDENDQNKLAAMAVDFMNSHKDLLVYLDTIKTYQINSEITQVVRPIKKKEIKKKEIEYSLNIRYSDSPENFVDTSELLKTVSTINRKMNESKGLVSYVYRLCEVYSILEDRDNVEALDAVLRALEKKSQIYRSSKDSFIRSREEQKDPNSKRIQRVRAASDAMYSILLLLDQESR